MASPATTQTVRPLDTLRFDTSGPPQIASVVADHLRLLGARTDRPVPDGHGDAPAAGTTLTGGGFEPAHASAGWADPASGLADEATVQAATGMMAVHGRRDGTPRGLAVDYAATATAVLTVQGLLANLVGQSRGGAAAAVTTSADRAGLLAVSQYLAAAGADEGEAAEIAAGGPPLTSADGILFELETLDPGAWAAFWRALQAPQDALRAGWRPFQFRYATACAPSRQPSTPPRGPTAGTGSAGPRPSPVPRCARCAPSRTGRRNTTAPPPGSSPRRRAAHQSAQRSAGRSAGRAARRPRRPAGRSPG